MYSLLRYYRLKPMYILVTYIYTLLCITTSKKALFNIIDLTLRRNIYVASQAMTKYGKGLWYWNRYRIANLCDLSGLTSSLLSERSDWTILSNLALTWFTASSFLDPNHTWNCKTLISPFVLSFYKSYSLNTTTVEFLFFVAYSASDNCAFKFSLA